MVVSICQKTDIARCTTIRTSKLLTPSAIAVVLWLEINDTSKGKFHIGIDCLLGSCTWQKTELEKQLTDANKASKPRSHYASKGKNTKQEICLECKVVIQDGVDMSDMGEDAPFCEGFCQAWIHRRCSSWDSVRNQGDDTPLYSVLRSSSSVKMKFKGRPPK